MATVTFAQNGNPPWKLAGNTISSGSFLGTINAEDLVFKVNGIEGLRLKTNDRKLIINGRSQFMLNAVFEAEVELQRTLTLKSLEDHLSKNHRLLGVDQYGVVKVITAATLLEATITDSLTLLGKVIATNGITFADGTTQTSAASLTGCNNAIFAEVNIVNELKLGANSLYLGSDSSGTDNYIYTDAGPLRINAQEGGNAAENTYINQDGGRVGIGTASPTAKLSLNGNESPKTLGTSTECAIKINNQYANTFGANTEIQFGIAAGITAAVIAAKYTSSGNGKAGSDLIFGTQSTLPNEVGVIERMRITHDGNIGIGTTNPNAKLAVKGRIETAREGFAGTYNSTEVQGIWSIGSSWGINTASNDFGNQYGMVYAHPNAGSSGPKKPIAGWEHQILFTQGGNKKAAISLTHGHAYFAGKVGVGTTNPSTKLSLSGNESPKTLGTSTECAIKINNEYANTFGANTEIQFGIAAGITAAVLAAKYTSSGNGKAGSDLIFGTQSTLPNEVGVIERMRITHDGNIGIGNTNPNAKLDVAGGVKVSGAFEVVGLTAIGTTINDPIYGFRENAPNSNGGNWYKAVLKGGLMVSGSSNGIFFRKGRDDDAPTAQVNGSIAMCLEDRPNGDANFNCSNPILGLNWFTPFPKETGSGGGNWQLFISAAAHNAGFVGLGTPYPKYRLSVNGFVGAREVILETEDWCDYVFANDYALMPLSEVERFIKTNQHLPEIPSATEVVKNGHKLAETNKLLLKKVEELTLYIIDIEKRLQQVEK
jgi:hypothetical protein